MKTIVDQFTMRPPDKQSLAHRLMGGKGRTTGVAVTVHKSTAPEAFFQKSQQARGQVVSNTYVLGDNGGLAGFGFLGSVGEREVLPGMAFTEGWSYNDFMGDENWLRQIGAACGLDARYAGGLSYRPPSAQLLSTAAAKWDQLLQVKDLSPAVNSFISNVESSIRSSIRLVDGLVNVGWDLLCGKRTKSVETQRISHFNSIIAQLSKVAQYQPPVETPSSPPPSTTTTGTSTTSGGGNTLDTLVAEAKARAAAEAKAKADALALTMRDTGGSAGASPAPGISPVILIGGGVAVLGLIALAFKMRK